nr:MAG TPA: hypothetical protein [Caudoviricetes sp.]
MIRLTNIALWSTYTHGRVVRARPFTIRDGSYTM